jgi:hypothetical protein
VRDVLICAPISGACVAGSIVGACEDCDQPVWIAPTSQRLIARDAVKIACTDCGFAAMRAEGLNPRAARPSPEQAIEIEGWMRRN